jgi:hypothetical protein
LIFLQPDFGMTYRINLPNPGMANEIFLGQRDQQSQFQ